MLPVYSPFSPAANDISVVPTAVTDRPQNVLERPRRETAEAIELGRADRPRFSFRPVRQGRILLTLNQLSVMTQNGVEIAEALENVAANCTDRRLEESLHAIHDAVEEGQSLSAAVGKHGVHFPATLAPMLAAAEASGEVPQTFRRVCHRMRGELQMRGTILGAMIYPIILVGASSVVLTALVLGVLPQFNKVFESMGRPVPIYTQMLLSAGDFCRSWWPLLLLTFVTLAAAGVWLRNSPFVRRPLNRLLMYGPLIGDAYRSLQAGRILRTLASMIQGGVPLLQSVQLTKRTTSDLYWQRLLDDIETKLIDGANASAAIDHADFVPPETAQLMATAERTGRIAEVLEDIGSFYEEEAERKIKRLVVMLEPAIIVVMGVIVAGIVMSVMLPLLDVSTIG